MSVSNGEMQPVPYDGITSLTINYFQMLLQFSVTTLLEFMTSISMLSENKNYYAEYYSGIRDLTLKYDIDYIPNPKHWIKAGAVSIYHRFNPHAFVEEDIPNNIHQRNIEYTNGLESGLYLEDTWQPVQASEN